MFVIEYEGLNAVTRIDPYSIPKIPETLSQQGAALHFSLVTLEAGFWQIEMHLPDSGKTAFNASSGPY